MQASLNRDLDREAARLELAEHEAECLDEACRYCNGTAGDY